MIEMTVDEIVALIRRKAEMMAADMVNYTAQTGLKEIGYLHALKELLTEIKHDGAYAMFTVKLSD